MVNIKEVDLKTMDPDLEDIMLKLYPGSLFENNCKKEVNQAGERVYLFDGPKLIDILRSRGIKFSVATSVRQHLWKEAEIYPSSNNIAFEVSNNQRKMLEYFK